MSLISKSATFAIGAVLGVYAFAAAVPGLADNPSTSMLDTLARGQWTVRIRGEDTTRKICLRSGREFIQLRHQQLRCARTIVDKSASSVTIHYKCADHGYGRTTIRRETANLVQITSQGISDGLPFEFDAEARRTGVCT